MRGDGGRLRVRCDGGRLRVRGDGGRVGLLILLFYFFFIIRLLLRANKNRLKENPASHQTLNISIISSHQPVACLLYSIKGLAKPLECTVVVIIHPPFYLFT